MKVILFLVIWLMSSGSWASADEKWGGTLVSFKSENPLAGETFTVPAVLWKPSGAPLGAVILVHGSGGWSDYREGALGKLLAERGFIALAIDYFSPRGISATMERQGGALASHVALEAFAAKGFLISMGITSDKIAILGFSLGGVVAHYTSDRTFFPDRKDQFYASIAYYPGCILHPIKPQPISKLFFLLGDSDNWTGFESCKELARDYASAGGDVKLKVYEKSSHGFDDHPNLTQLTYLPKIETYVNCQAPINAERIVTFNGKKYDFPKEDLAVVRAMQRSCTKFGASIWTNTTAKQSATSDVVDFLMATIAKN